MGSEYPVSTWIAEYLNISPILTNKYLKWFGWGGWAHLAKLDIISTVVLSAHSASQQQFIFLVFYKPPPLSNP